MLAGMPTKTPLLSTSSGRVELQQLHGERATGWIALGFVGMLPWDNLAPVPRTP